MIILLINNQNVKDKGYDLKGGNEYNDTKN